MNGKRLRRFVRSPLLAVALAGNDMVQAGMPMVHCLRFAR